MVIKDIYLAKIHFTNESGAKIRPVLLIRKNSFGDYVFLPLTSNLESKGVVLESTDTEHRSLPKKSVVLTEKISIISPSLLLRKIGAVKENIFKRIVDNVCEFIQGE